jgi:hypothetical protein
MLSSFSYNPRRAEAERGRGRDDFLLIFQAEIIPAERASEKRRERERELKNAAARERAEWRQECRRRRRLVIRPEKK